MLLRDVVVVVLLFAAANRSSVLFVVCRLSFSLYAGVCCSMLLSSVAVVVVR